MVTQKEIDDFMESRDYIKCNRRFGNAIIQREYCKKRSKMKIKFNLVLGGNIKNIKGGEFLPFDTTCHECEYWKEAESI
jgi:hypothetical protein